jgi:hypothetical protein
MPEILRPEGVDNFQSDGLHRGRTWPSGSRNRLPDRGTFPAELVAGCSAKIHVARLCARRFRIAGTSARVRIAQNLVGRKPLPVALALSRQARRRLEREGGLQIRALRAHSFMRRKSCSGITFAGGRRRDNRFQARLVETARAGRPH